MNNFFEKTKENLSPELGNGINFTSLIKDAISKISSRKRFHITSHLLFQGLLNTYFGEGEKLQEFVEYNGYEFIKHFLNIEDFVLYIKNNPQIEKEIIEQNINIAFVFEDMKPVHLVLARCIESPDKVTKKIQDITAAICESNPLPNIQL